MAIALVAGQTAVKDGAGLSSPQSVVLPNNPTAGNFVVVLAVFGNSNFPSTFAMKDANSNTYVATTKTPFVSSANGQSSGIYYLKNAPANALKTITITWTGGAVQSFDLWALEFSGVDTVSPFENDATATNTSASTYTTPSYTTLNDGDLLVSAAGCNGTISGVGTPWTAAPGIPTAEGEGGEYFIQTTHGAQAVAYTLSVNGTGSTIIAAFKAASATTPKVTNSFVNPGLPPSVIDWQKFTIPVGQDFLPFRQRYWPNPNIPVYYDDYSWDDFFSPNLVGKDKLPTGVQRTVVPYGPIPPVRDWIEYLNPPAFPLVTQRAEVPYGPWSNPFWVDFLNPPGFPTIQQRIEVPPRGPPPNPYWTFELNPPAFPTVQVRTEVPFGPSSNPYWINFTALSTLVVSTPFVSTVWFVPKGPDIKVTDWQDYIIPAGQDLLPFRTDTRNPVLSILPNKDYQQSLNLELVVIINPQTGQVFFVPLGQLSNPYWINYIIPAGQDLLPFNQDNWPVPRGPYYPDQTFYQYVQQQVSLPPGQQIWLVPTGTSSNPSYTAFIVPAGQDQLPFNQKNWPVPYGTFPGQDWKQAYNNALNFIINPGPPGILFNQYNWPNPTVLSIGNLDWQNFLTNIPQPSPVELISSGRYLTEADVEASKHVKWRYKEGADILYKHMAAVNLGRKGGIQSGKSRRSR